MANQEDFVWQTTGEGGVQFSLRLPKTPASTAEPLEVIAAVRNPGTKPVTIRADLALAVDNGGEVRHHVSGPHSAAEHTLAPGEVRELRSWRIYDHGLSRGRRSQIWLTPRLDPKRPTLSNVVRVSLPG
jgi:hypothetical protein